MQAHTFIPVNGSVPPWAPEDDVVPLEAEVPVARVDGAWESDELLLLLEEVLLGLELDEDGELLG
jgi:hypothetical protein